MRANYKVVVMGDAGVGKTQLLSRYLYNDYYMEEHVPTIGIDFGLKKLEIGSRPINVHFWDTAGQERFHSMSDRLYLRNAMGVILVYDVTNRRSFEHLSSWKRRIDTCESTCYDVACILVGNKRDLSQARAVSTEEGLQWADQHSMMFLESSAKTGENVDHAFGLAVGEIDRKRIARRLSDDFTSGRTHYRLLTLPPSSPVDSTSCCR